MKPKYDEENLVYVINDLFLGGSETVSTTLYWGLLYMVVNPDIQGERHSRHSCCEMLQVLQVLMVAEYNKLQAQKPLVEPGFRSLKTQRMAGEEKKIRSPSYNLTKPGG